MHYFFPSKLEFFMNWHVQSNSLVKRPDWLHSHANQRRHWMHLDRRSGFGCSNYVVWGASGARYWTVPMRSQEAQFDHLPLCQRSRPIKGSNANASKLKPSNIFINWVFPSFPITRFWISFWVLLIQVKANRHVHTVSVYLIKLKFIQKYTIKYT